VSEPGPRVLGGRYELGETVGVGGMAEVFRGTDTRLGRDVAVKVLRPELARDPSFQGRFRREAQAAASLDAPCIVSVFDTGEDDDGVPYIVMEHVSGRTLRDVLQEEGRLLPQRALEITADVCAALSVAHAAGIVHRDIKPANVMLTGAGDVKVMDFGIARAAAGGSQTMTQTAAVIGTAAYLSPEQARGEHVDARSDVYSTGCLLYELITGSPPFTGDSVVAVAYQHVREDPVPPTTYDDTLSSDVDAVVLKAMAKNPANRYQSAVEMREDLLRAATGQPVAATPVLLGEPADATPAPHGSVPLTDPGARGRRRQALYALFGLLLAAVVLGAALLVRSLGGSDAPALVPTPSVVGQSQQEAAATLARAGLRVEQPVLQEFSEEPVGTVTGQSPTAQFLVDRGSSVRLTVSKGQEMSVVPDVVGLSQAEATAQLETAKLGVGKVVTRDGNVAPGQVLEVIPAAGTAEAAGTPVTLVVASGRVNVPDVRGRTEQAATDLLQKAGFEVRVVDVASASPVGTVLGQSPVNTLAERGSTVTLRVARPRPAPAPSATVTPSPPPPSPSPSPTVSPSPSPTI
jgi:eukaryotic-like serine/threonine-protein kinase